MNHRRSVSAYFVDPRLLPRGFKYPASYVVFARSSPPILIGPVNEDWCVLDATEIEQYFHYVREAFPSQNLVPFMRRNGDDGVACFDWSVPSDDPQVVYCQVFQNLGCWPENATFSEWLVRIPPRDPEDD